MDFSSAVLVSLINLVNIYVNDDDDHENERVN